MFRLPDEVKSHKIGEFDIIEKHNVSGVAYLQVLNKCRQNMVAYTNSSIQEKHSIHKMAHKIGCANLSCFLLIFGVVKAVEEKYLVSIKTNQFKSQS